MHYRCICDFLFNWHDLQLTLFLFIIVLPLVRLGALTSREGEGKIGQKANPTFLEFVESHVVSSIYLVYFMLNVDGSGHANQA